MWPRGVVIGCSCVLFARESVHQHVERREESLCSLLKHYEKNNYVFDKHVNVLLCRF